MTAPELAVLIVEDSEDDAMLVVAALEDTAHRVRWRRVEDADEMAVALAEERWDIVLSDHTLPRFDSSAAMRVLSTSGCRAPLVVVSGAIGEEAAAAAVRMGAADYVSKDRLSRLAGVVRTQLREAELSAAQLRSEEQFRSAFDDAPFGSAVIALGRDGGRLLRVNDALCKAARRAKELLLDLHIQELLHPDDRRGLANGLKALRDGREHTYRAEVRLLDAAGRAAWFLVSLSAVRESGRGRAIAQFVDIDDRKRVEDALQLANREALEASRYKSEFVANMSHEIRTPLNGVVGLGELLAETNLDADQRAYVAGIRGSGDALMGVITAVLDFSQIDSGKLTLNPADFEPRKIVADTCAMLVTTATEKGLKLMTAVDATVPDSLHGDGRRIRQVLINVVGNAVKFTDSGEVTVALRLADGEALALDFVVTDTGPGVESTARLFDPFWQADSSMTRRHAGTGLGLTIVKQMIALMGGTIDFESTPGAGSRVRITIPVEQAHGNLGPPIDLSTIRSLVVDDKATPRMISTRQLSWPGARVTPIVDVKAVLPELEAAVTAGDHYDVVVADLLMKGPDGRDLATAIRANPRLDDTAVIVLAYDAVSPDALENAGVDGFLIKPTSRTLLRVEIARVLAARRTAPGVPATRSLEHARQASGRVLLVEDDASNRLFAGHLLKHDGWQVEFAENGREAVAQAATSSYDVILMDCQMPELDGYHATDEIRRNEAGERHTPIIALTAHASERDRVRCLEAGMDDYIAKPFTPAALDEALQRALRSVSREGGRAGSPPARPGSARNRLAPVLDSSRLDLIYRTDAVAAENLADTFISSARQRITELGLAETARDTTTVKSLTHALKGSAATIGAMRMSDACERLGKTATSGAIDVSKQQMELETAFALTEAALQKLCGKTSHDH
jgi:two-component system, sensor histidine kinase and response regulator